ncbi:hypothetical protein N7510_001969 [Penicillium lagena]|uniref:uncharacterized protein n=1 Tax=Penicillium lagena TaxID=94218 RepID=UPI0025419C0A|nr:uncharacterized protein N7510_001969 [Penicillium lagena]KAJ5625660.1 hypothetical protein N7510_001969 [Penicillium lagena]
MKHSSFLPFLAGISATNAGKSDATLLARSSAPACSNAPSTLSLPDAPYDNFFYSDCNVAAQAVVTTPLPDSDLTQIGPRLIVAWTAGNSGACSFFAPQNGVNGSLAIALVNSTVGNPLAPVYSSANNGSANPSVGVKSVLRFNSSAILTIPILGSIRTIRDFTEGPSILYPEIQDAITFTTNGNGVQLNRVWLDNVTSTTLTFQPWGSNSTGKATVVNRTVHFEQGDYLFSAAMSYPQMTQLEPASVLNSESADLITQMPGQTAALSFLSYSEKLLAGAWRFLTYFGRDSMISALLLEPVLSSGQGSAMEAVIGAVLERVNRTDGSVCHEETIGDYATWTNEQEGIYSNAMSCDYKMIDSDYYLPVLMQKYFLQNPIGKSRATAFFNTQAGSVNAANRNLTWGDLALINAERIMRLTGPFAKKQTKDNLIHLKEGQIVGQWRDSTYGIGGGRIPYDVNTALAPAALRSVAALARSGVYPHEKQWATEADKNAKVWEDSTLQFFEVTIPQKEAQSRIDTYQTRAPFTVPTNTSQTIDSDVIFHALSLDGYDSLSQVQVMNTDDCFRHFLLNTTNEAQLTSFLNQTASNIRRTFPAGLMTDAGMVVANPAFGSEDVYAQNWTTGAYHGTVVWSWPLAMMGKGLELQMARCDQKTKTSVPQFCHDVSVLDNVKTAYNTLWDSIEANSQQLSTEVWSWVYRNGEFDVTPLGVMPPPPGAGSQTGMFLFLFSFYFSFL